MHDKEETGRDGTPWAVRYPTQVSLRAPGQSRREQTRTRWSEIGKVDGREVRKRLLWLLLAVEMGMALAAACVLPLLFLNVTTGGSGIVEAYLERMADPRISPAGTLCLGLFLMMPVLLLALALSVGIYHLLQKSRKDPNAQGNQ